MAENEDDLGQTLEDGFKDPQNVFPRVKYYNKQSTNFAARNIQNNDLYIGGGDVALSLGLQPHTDTQYPMNQVRETVSGHVTEIDDTPGAERILFKHKTGAGVEMRANGTVIISSTNNTVQITGGDQKVIVEGDGEIVYHGNLKLTVNGNFDLNVGGDFNVTTGGDNVETVKGSYKQTVSNFHETTVTKSKSQFVGKNTSSTILGDNNTTVKGENNNYNQGDYNLHVGYIDPETEENIGALRISATDEIMMSAANMNGMATDMTWVGDHGDIGGDNIVMHNYNMYTGHSIDVGNTLTVPTIYNDTQVTSGHMNIPVVYGDLQGTATQAMVSNQAGLHPSSGAHAGAGYGYTAATDTTADIAVDPFLRTRVNTAIADEYLYKSDRGISDVNIDFGGEMLDTVDKSRPYDNISQRKLTTPEIRSKLRDPNALRNETFINAQILEGKLSADYINPVPPFGYGRVVNKGTTPIRGSATLPNSDITKRVI
jgi:hypothetical protein